jgi:putative transposase
MLFVPRKSLPHEVPPWVASGAFYFVTIHGAPDSVEFTLPHVAQELLQSVQYYHAQGRWFSRLFLLMPDHVHALVSFPATDALTKTVRDWKKYTARTTGVRWQRDFFDHRIRNDENWELKAAYIRQNPVRKNLVDTAENWPWIFQA